MISIELLVQFQMITMLTFHFIEKKSMEFKMKKKIDRKGSII